MKVLVVGDDKKYGTWVDDKVEFVKFLTNADLIIFTGGEDVSPSMYGETNIHPFTQCNPHRDKIEKAIFEKAKRLNKPMIGICRGSQFLTAMAGGRVIQHVKNHNIGKMHEIKILNGNSVYEITSTHHQMMYPYTASKYNIIAISNEVLSDDHFENERTKCAMVEEPEIVFYPEIRALCIQGHPEIMHNEDPVVIFLRKLIKSKLYE